MVAISNIIFCSVLTILGSLGPGNAEELKNLNFKLRNAAVNGEGSNWEPIKRIEAAGYVGETHFVTTQDGYILRMHRITGPKANPKADGKPAVYLQHGLEDCSGTWVVPKPSEGLVYMLADWGYDVWLGNARGNRFSRSHVNMTTDDPDYWTFSWHEIGIYDLPAMIDLVRYTTKQEKIFYIGHSQGSTAFFVMASERPEYQDKLITAFAMAPVVFMGRAVNPLIRMVVPFIDNIRRVTDMIGLYEFAPSDETVHKLQKLVCGNDALTQPLCSSVLFLLAGFPDPDFDIDDLSDVLDYDLAGSSTRQIIHYAQLINSGRFQKYSYGLTGNIKKYGTTLPPEYDLSKIKMHVYLHYSDNDWFVNVRDLDILYSKLSNVDRLLVPQKGFTHLDFVWGMHAHNLVYTKILSFMESYRKHFCEVDS